MIGGLLIVRSLTADSPKEFAQLCPSRNGFAELEVNGVGHLYCLRLYDLCKAEKVFNREYPQTLVPTRSMTDQPGADRSSVLLVLDIEVEKARWDASFACLVGGVAQHGRIPRQDVGLDERDTGTGLSIAKQS